jgi:hypothetical protein
MRTMSSKYQDSYEAFVARCERFVARHDLAPSRFGRDAVNDPRFITDMRRGKVPRPATMDKVEEYMRHYKRCAAPAASVHASAD